jgi:hypothetical protein
MSIKYYVLCVLCILALPCFPLANLVSSAPSYIVISGLSDSAIFSTLSHKRHDFRIKLLNVKCLSATLLIISRIQRDNIVNVYWSSCKIPFLSGFNQSWISSRDLRKIIKYPISWKLIQWRAGPCWQTDGHAKANSCLSKFCKRA